jgi:hypothetical protein
MKKILEILLVFLICIIIYDRKDAHTCKWRLCPYKGIYHNQWSERVTEYVGDIGTDAWHLDMLHLQYPKKEYEELEQLLDNH